MEVLRNGAKILHTVRNRDTPCSKHLIRATTPVRPFELRKFLLKLDIIRLSFGIWLKSHSACHPRSPQAEESAQEKPPSAETLEG